jgi:hypothetical protein
MPVSQVASLTRAGKGGGRGSGEVVVGGTGGETMRDPVMAAHRWVVHNQKAIRRVLRLPQVGRIQGVILEQSTPNNTGEDFLRACVYVGGEN